MRHNEEAVSTRFFISPVLWNRTYTQAQWWTAWNFENAITEAINNLPDDTEELLAADPNSYAGTLRDIIKAMAQQTNRGCAISEYMGCEV